MVCFSRIYEYNHSLSLNSLISLMINPVFMKSRLFIIVFMALSAGSYLFYFPFLSFQDEQCLNQAGKKVEIEGEPGWYTQYFEMKKNENGVIPPGILMNVYDKLNSGKSNKRSSVSGVSNLKNIVELGPSNV